MLLINKVIKEFENIINALGPAFRQQDKTAVLDLCEHNECGVAFELLCTQIYEFDVKIPYNVFEKIKQLGIFLEMESYNWEDLAKLVVKIN